MATIGTYTLTVSDLEDIADAVKCQVLDALVCEGVMEACAADAWARDHAVVFRKRSIFRTLTRLWSDTPEDDGLNGIVVKKV